MDFNVLMEFLKTFGFPVVACAALYYQQNKNMKDFGDKMEKALSNLSSSITANTMATNELVTTVEILQKVQDS